MNKIFDALPEEDFECPKHGTYRRNPYMLFGKTRHNPVCPEEAEALQKAEEAQQHRIRLLKDMHIGKRDWDNSFSNFDAYTDELQKHLRIAMLFANNPEGKLLMIGTNGTGKNHLAVSILKETGGIIYTAADICLKLKESYNGVSREYEVLKELCDINVLIIDEIGRTKGSGWELNWLSHVVNTRHVNMLPTIFITNKHMKKDCPSGEKGCSDCLQNFVDQDVISRIQEDGIVMKFTGNDYRDIKGKEFRSRKREEFTQQNCW